MRSKDVVFQRGTVARGREQEPEFTQGCTSIPDTCDQRPPHPEGSGITNYQALFSSFTFNRFLGPSELLAAGEGVGARLAL